MAIQTLFNARNIHRHLMFIVALVSLGLCVSSAPLHAQMAPLINRVPPREVLPETTSSLVTKISHAHQQGIGNAGALASYVEANSYNLSNTTMRLHCDAIGRSLDDALQLSARLATTLTSNTAHVRALMMSQHDTHAKQTYRTLLGMLRGSSTTAPQIRMMAIQIHQDISAAEQELAQIPNPKSADAGTRSK